MILPDMILPTLARLLNPMISHERGQECREPERHLCTAIRQNRSISGRFFLRLKNVRTFNAQLSTLNFQQCGRLNVERWTLSVGR